MRKSHMTSVLNTGVLLLALLAGSAQSATRIVSGYLSGLNRGETVTLLQNGADALTLGTNGIFNFATPVPSGASFEVSIGTQPNSQVCTVDAGGSAAMPGGGVTQVAISCAASTGTGTAGSWWIPYTASPKNAAGLSGLFLIASDKLHSAPKQQFIVKTKAEVLAEGAKITAAGLAGVQPMNLMYSAVGADGGTHVYGVPINNTSVVPKPSQITNLSLKSPQTICDRSSAQTNVADATTLFVVLDVSTPPCGLHASTFYVIHFKDGAAAAPTKVNITTTQISTLYNNGLLVGLYLYNAPTKSLNYYATNAFTSPKELVTSINNVLDIANSANIASGSTFGATVFFPAVIGVTAAGNALYRIESTAANIATMIHKGSVYNGVIDNKNLYFEDTSSASNAVFYQVGLTAATPMQLFSAPISNPPYSSYRLIGTDTARLAFVQTDSLPTQTASISTIPIGVKSTKPTLIAGPYASSFVEPFLARPSVNDWAANKLFLNIVNFASTLTYSSTATTLNAKAPAPAKNSAYEPFGSASVWQSKGITATDGGLGGASINEVNVATLAASPLTTTGGGVFHIPAHHSGFLYEVSSASIAVGTLAGSSAALPWIGLACDVAGRFLIEETDANTNVSAF